MKKKEKSPSFFSKEKLPYWLLTCCILFVVIIRVHLLSFPLERDEGEYAYMGKLILDGHLPYSLAYNMKLPGTYFMYALIMGIFGQSIIGIHIGVMLINIASILLLFFIASNFVSKTGAVIASASYGLMSSSWSLLAQAGHATHFVVFFALLAIYFLLRAEKTQKRSGLYFLAGLFFSFAFICKQSGLFFLLVGVTIIAIDNFKKKSLLSGIKEEGFLGIGFLLPIGLMLLVFYFFGNFEKFWFWTVKYLKEYGTQLGISDAKEMFLSGLSRMTAGYTNEGYIGLWIISVLGFPIIFFSKTATRTKIILVSLCVFSFLTIIPGFYFRNHYFITLLPAAALLIALFYDFLTNTLHNSRSQIIRVAPVLIYILVLFLSIRANRDYMFVQSPLLSCKRVYSLNPFAESIKLADFIKKNTNKNDKIAVLGSEPQIFFYADRYSATGYIYTYDLVSSQPYALTMQKEMAQEIEAQNPKFIVFVQLQFSWLIHPDAPMYIFQWADQYLKKYNLVSFVELLPNSSIFYSGDKLDPASQTSKVLLYKRKSE